MKLILIVLAFIFIDSEFSKWGQIGHYTSGDIAGVHLNEKARGEMERILGNESLAMASVWMDDIRSDDDYNYTSDWHWVTIPDGKSYDETGKNPNGDIIWALEKLIGELKAGGLTETEEREKLKMVIHMIGDIHQPLHVGTGDDRGGNDVRVEWMGESSNLHRVWDSDMIRSRELSYTELAKEINHPTDEQITEWQSATVREWAEESKSYRHQVYDISRNNRLGYEYRYKNFDLVKKRLLQAGVRIAGVINEIYGQ